MNILITGASRGIGRAIAETLGQDGMTRMDTFFITCKSNIRALMEVYNELGYHGNNVVMYHLDVTDRLNVKNVVESFKKGNFRLDVLINNAGIVKDRTLKKMTDEEWDDVINTNLTGIHNVTKAFLPYMNDGGCIINITSIIGITGGFGQVNYAASKAGVIGFTKALAKELASKNIRVNAVACGFTNTDMTATIPPQIKEKILSTIPMKRFADPKEIASFVRWLIEHGTYCTGQVYIIDGGLT